MENIPGSFRHRYLLAQRLLLPIFAVAITVALALIGLLYKNTHDMLDEMAIERAMAVAHPFKSLADDSLHNNSHLTLSEGNDVSAVMVVKGEDVSVYSSRGIHSISLTDIGGDETHRLVRHVLATGRSQSVLDENHDIHTYVLSAGKNGAVVVQSDLAVYDAKAHQQMLSIGTIVVLVVLGLAGVMYLLLHHSVLAPLTEIHEVIRLRKNGKINQRITHVGDDELGEVAEQLNHMMDVENLVQSKLAQYADEMEQQNQELTKARDEAERATRHKSEFLAMISHEIRTPMNAIIGTVELLEKTQLNGKQKRYLQTVSGSAEILLEIINSVLDFSKIEAGKLVLDTRPCNLAEVLQSVSNMMAPRVEQKGLLLRTNIGKGVPPVAEVDALRLRQILVNLVGNAVKFTAAGGITVEVERAAEKKGKTMVRFKVTDTGIGISPEKQIQIFEKFTQAEVGTTRKYGGTGLGLAISCQLVGLMGGTIGVESAEGKGSTFWFILPLQAAQAEALAEEKAEESKSKALPVKGGHVLLVEDNAINQMMEQEMLEQLGLTVTCAANGLQAVEKIEGGMHYNLVLMDCQMPEMDGYLATQKIRAYQRGKGEPPMPIVALTANVSAEDQTRCREAGMDDYISKPVRLNDLENKVLHWLNKGGKT